MPSSNASNIKNKISRFGIPNQIISNNKSSFSSLYRLVDVGVISGIFFSVLFFHQIEARADGMAAAFVSIVSFMLCAESSDLYRSWRTASNLLMIKTVVAVWAIICLITVAFAYFFPEFVGYSTSVIIYWLGFTGAGLLAWRVIFRNILFYYRRNGRNTRQAIVIGATPVGINLAQQLKNNSQSGIIFKGYFDDRKAERLPLQFADQVLGNVDDAIKLAKSNEFDQIYIALNMSAEKRISEILSACSDTTATVLIVPNFFVYNLLNARWQTIGTMQALSVYDTPFQGSGVVLKRFQDVVISTLALSVSLIPMLLIAIAIKLTSRGPVIFKQHRYGLDGKQIVMYKFRSMSTQDNGEVVKQATKNDSRTTPVGAFLRRTSLDELPQLINVLQGVMSIVGPRPHAVVHNEKYRILVEGYMLRHKVKPGITGWAQINGFRGETRTLDQMAKRVEYDLEYIHNWSIWMDMKIMILTSFKGFTGEKAY